MKTLAQIMYDNAPLATRQKIDSMIAAGKRIALYIDNSGTLVVDEIHEEGK